MNKEKVIYRGYLISAIVISLITTLVLIYSLFYLDSFYLILSFWSPIASIWLYFNLIILTLYLFDKIKNFSPLLPCLYVFGEIFSGIVDGMLRFIALKNGTNPLLMASGFLATILNMIIPLIAIVVAIILILKNK